MAYETVALCDICIEEANPKLAVMEYVGDAKSLLACKKHAKQILGWNRTAKAGGNYSAIVVVRTFEPGDLSL